MNINKNNYEAFFLDYHEGNLSPQQVADLLLFIDQHPDLKEEFESFENVSLEDFSEITFENKSGLKKEITTDNKDEYFIKSIEKIITPAEKTLLDNFLKLHPQHVTDFNLFQKTKSKPDTLIVFENKEALKRTVITTDDLLIASIEGLLSKGETVLLNQQLAVDPEMQHNLSFYKQTKLIADTSIIFEGKDELKRKEKKVIPLFYYIAVAASLLFLFGLYFISNNTSDEKHFAAENKVAPVIRHPELKNEEKSIIDKGQTSFPVNPYTANYSPVIKKRLTKNKIQMSVPENKEEIKPLSQDNIIATTDENKKENTPLPIKQNEEVAIINNTQETKLQQPVTAQIIEKNEDSKSITYPSLRQLAAEKIKEKTLDENTLAMQKKSGRLKKFNGWDLAQIVTKGISKLTGHDLEVKSTYNSDGDITAYALGSGIELKKGK